MEKEADELKQIPDIPLSSCLQNGCYGKRLKVGVSVCQFIAL